MTRILAATSRVLATAVVTIWNEKARWTTRKDAAQPVSTAIEARAGFGIRLLAYIIDVIILAIVSAVVTLVFGAAGDAGQTIAGVINAVIGLAYTLYFWSTSGATPGKSVLGLRVVAIDGSPMNITKAIMRLIGYVVSSVVLFLGFIWIIFDGQKQGWHDKIAGTYVIKTR